MKTALRLKKETLAELTPDALRAVQGGAASVSCTSCFCTCDYHSCNTDTPTDILRDVVSGNLHVNC